VPVANEHYIGIMSGTSLDGVDAVLAVFNGDKPSQLSAVHHEFDPALKQVLLSLNADGNNELEIAALVSNELARNYAHAASDVIRAAGLSPHHIAAIGCHGQTVRHRPDLGFTVQLNNPSLLAELTGVAVVADFRSRDMAAGGQGAPLVPAFHAALFGSDEISRAIVNIGGISNLTSLPVRGPVAGFDCGPGNVLMDAWVQQHLGVAFDRDGEWALGGHLLPDLLRAMLQEPYFSLPPPKSTGRDLFNLPWLQQFLHPGVAPRDVQTTLLALTVKSVADAVRRQANGAVEVYVCGGGARNTALMAAFRSELIPMQVSTTDELGINAEHVEALAFAWLARQTLHMQPGNLPAVTGARGLRVLGAIYPI
jgi:anhydro-N-acetylmuramic acid kinase